MSDDHPISHALRAEIRLAVREGFDLAIRESEARTEKIVAPIIDRLDEHADEFNGKGGELGFRTRLTAAETAIVQIDKRRERWETAIIGAVVVAIAGFIGGMWHFVFGGGQPPTTGGHP